MRKRFCSPLPTMKKTIIANWIGSTIDANDDYARDLCNRSCIGAMAEKGHVQYSPVEALYLAELDKLQFVKQKKKISFKTVKHELIKKNPLIVDQLVVYKRLRQQGYIVKSGLKYGAQFRVYEKSVKPGQDHAKWIVEVIHEKDKLKLTDFSAKNRVAHSTKKKLILAIVDDDLDVTFFEINWLRL